MTLAGILSCAVGAAPAGERGAPWRRHTIDDTSQGADGVRLGDADGDGLPDIVTGWEEGGVVRVYVNPGPAKAKERWPFVEVGRVVRPEDAVLADLDGDGAVDVVSSCEGGNRTMYVHWAPKDKRKYLDPGAWKTEPVPASRQKMQWMFCVPAQVDGRNGIDLFAAGKSRGAKVGWFEAPENPRDLSEWAWHEISVVGWTMSLAAMDMDGDGDMDVLVSDRINYRKNKELLRGIRWLEHPGSAGVKKGEAWKNHFLAGQDRQVMFMAVADMDGDGSQDIVSAVSGGPLLYLKHKKGPPPTWEAVEIPMPENVGTGKAVNVGDVDRDGRLDIVVSCEHAGQGRSGVFWMSREYKDRSDWRAHEISGPKGVKFDLVELLDLDGDGDLDVITCEERENLGVIWYENPTR